MRINELSGVLGFLAETGRAADRLAARLGPAVLVLVAVAYYASYFMHGLNLGGEGGTTAVLAMRLMEGQRPIVDTFLGYNVLWFLPIGWLFAWTGPDYLAMKAFFFVLCGISALLAWVTVWRVSRSGLLALATGLALVLIPGMLFRNYMGLLGVANQLVLLSAFLLPVRGPRTRIALIALSGFVLGVTFLIRVELGLFMGILWMGLLVLNLLLPGRPIWIGARESLVGGALGVCALCLVHTPFAVDAWQRGYAPQFFGQYSEFVGLMRWEIQKYLRTSQEPSIAASARPATTTPSSTSEEDAEGASPKSLNDAASPPRVLSSRRDVAIHPMQPSEMRLNTGTDANEFGADSSAVPRHNPPSVAPHENKSAVPISPSPGVDGRRPKAPISDILFGKKSRDRFFAAALFFPVVLAPLLVAGALLAAGVALARRDETLWRDALVILVAVGCALTLFPQYFFFRPDTPHLVEFMIPFLPALACTLAIVFRRVHAKPSRIGICLAGSVVVLVGLQTWVHFGHALPKESAGTAAARKHGPDVFWGQNRVIAKLRPENAAALQGLHDTIVANSTPADWVVALPYSPTINFMTDRPSYLRDLYTDNTMAGPQFDEDRIAELLKYQPAAVVIDHRAINNTEASRFPNWAPVFYAYLKEHYEFVGEFLNNELFLRRDRTGRGESSP